MLISAVSGLKAGASPVFPAQDGIIPEFNLLLNLIFVRTRFQNAATGAGQDWQIENLDFVNIAPA